MSKIPYGISSFERIRNKEENYLYIDKTRFIETMEQTSFIIHLRPRRFGKSLFLSMLEAYYDIASAHKFDDLFGGLYIHEHPTVNRNNYMVLRFNFSGIETKDVEAINRGFSFKVKEAIENFISKYDLEIQLEDTSSPSIMLNQLLSTVGRLNLSHKVYILIDEYDHFTNAVLNEGLEGFMTLVTRGGMVRSFYEVIKEKTESSMVDRLFMTGVMSVSLDSMTSGFNIATNITTSPDYADMMGFTGSEVKAVLAEELGDKGKEVLLTETEQEDVFEVFRQNYNGYLFAVNSNQKVFNSTLIMYYLKHYLPRKEALDNLVDPNLNQSGRTIMGIVDVKNQEVNYQIVEEIIRNRSISGKLSTFIDIDKRFDKNDFITLLFNIGFLTIKSKGMLTTFEIPNKIIEAVYFEYLNEMADRRHSYQIDVATQERALLEMGERGKIDTITHLVEDFLEHISGRNALNFNEQDIKLTYLQFLFPTNQYIIFDELPAKQGYSDLTILKSSVSYAKYEFLIELKYLKKSETTDAKIEAKFSEGVQQVQGYVKDKRLQGRPHLKKFVVVFSGFTAVKYEEIL